MRRQLMRMWRRLRKVNRVVTLLLYTAFALLTFLVSLSLSLPVEKIKDRIERELSQEQGPPIASTGSFGIGTGMDVSIGDLDLQVFGPGVSATEVRLRPRKVLGGSSDAPAAKNPRPITIDRLDVKVHPLDAMLGKKSGAVAVEAFGGELKAEGSQSDDGIDGAANIHDVALARLSVLSGMLPLPMLGTLGMSLHFKVPSQKPTTPPRTNVGAPLGAPPLRLDLAKAVGELELQLAQATLGDGKAKLVVPGDPFMSQGITFPRIRLGDVIGKVNIERGRANILDLHAKSADVEIWIDGYLELRDPLALSEARLYVRFKPSPQLTAREPTMELVANSQAQGKRADGAIGFAITGSLANPRARATKDPPDGVVLRAGSLGQVAPAAKPSLVPGSSAPPSIPLPPPAPTPAAYQPPPPPPTPSSETVVVPPPPQNPPPIQQANPSPPPNPMANVPPPPGSLHTAPPAMQVIQPASEAPTQPSHAETPHPPETSPTPAQQ